MFNLDYRNVYSEVRDNVPFTYHLPTVACQVMWIAMLKEKIKTPMNFFLVKTQNTFILFLKYIPYRAFMNSQFVFYRAKATICGGKISMYIRHCAPHLQTMKQACTKNGVTKFPKK